MDQLVDCLSINLKSYDLSDHQFWVAYSGGLDSTVLLHAAWRYFRDQNRLDQLAVIHVDHGIQSQSRQWLDHCRGVANKLGVAFHSAELHLDGDSGNLEELARKGRYGVFERLLNQRSVLMMAHHLNDQAETVLFRLMRGSGTQGLSGMPDKRKLGEGELIRPFLSVSRETLVRAAEDHCLGWIDDPSNLNVDFDRNFLRHQVLPLLQSRWPKAAQQIAKSAGHCRSSFEQEHWLAEQDWKTLDVCLELAGFSVDLAKLKKLPNPRLESCLRFGFQHLQVSLPSEAQMSEIMKQLIDDEARTDSNAAVKWGAYSDSEPTLFCASRFRNRLHVLLDLSEAPCLGDCHEQRIEVDLADITLKGATVSVPLAWGSHWCVELSSAGHLFDTSVSKQLLMFKPRTGGERSHPSSRAHSQKLKKLLQESNLPPWLRDIIPLIYSGDDLVAVGDLWVEKPFFNPQTTGLKITLNNTHPWQCWLRGVFSGG